MKKCQIKAENPNSNSELGSLIESKRGPLFAEFTRSRKISNILTIIILIIACAGMYFIIAEAPWMRILGWALLVGGVLVMVLYYFLNKKSFENHTKEYIGFVSDKLTAATFEDKSFGNVVTTDKKLEINDLNNNGAYANIIRVASRNSITGKFGKKEFTFSDIALFKNGPKKGQSVAAFVGKYITLKNTIKVSEPIVIEIQGKEPMDLPTAVEGKVPLLEDGNLRIYGASDINFKDTLGEQFISSLKKINLNVHLLNLAIAINDGITHVFMSYDDAVVAIPFDKPLNADAFKQFTDDLKAVFNLVSLLGK